MIEETPSKKYFTKDVMKYLEGQTRLKIPDWTRRSIWSQARNMGIKPRQDDPYSHLYIHKDELLVFAKKFDPHYQKAVPEKDTKPLPPETLAMFERARANQAAHLAQVIEVCDRTGERAYDVSLRLREKVDPKWAKEVNGAVQSKTGSSLPRNGDGPEGEDRGIVERDETQRNLAGKGGAGGGHSIRERAEDIRRHIKGRAVKVR